MSKKKITMGQVFKTIIWPRKNIIFFGLFLIILSKLAVFTVPEVTRFLIDDVLDQPIPDYNVLTWVVGVVVVAITIQAITSFLLTRILSVEAQHLISKLRAQVQQKILSLPVNFFDDHKSGELVSRVMTDVEGVRNLVGTGLAQLVGGIITVLIAVVWLFIISWSMTLMVLVPVIIFGVISLKAFGFIRPIFRERGKINADVTGRLTETLNGIRVIKGFNAEKQEIAVFEDGVDRLFQNVKKSLTSTSLITSSATFLLGLASAGILGYGSYLVMEGDISSGDFVQFTFLLALMIAPIIQMSNIGSQLTEAFAGLDRTEELMNMEPEDDGSRTDVLDDINGDLKFDNVSFAYEEGKEVVHNISFDAPKGTVTALVGSSGSGKSTLAGLAASFISPQSGVVSMDGHDISKVKLDSYRQFLGVVLQDDFLFEGTIKDNILFPRPDATEEQLQEAIKAAYVNEFTDRFEDGIETVIGERGVKLSGGQRQRIAIARAILADPKILILDEATSNLDTESESLIQKSLNGLMEGRTTIVIAHRLSTIRKANQILVIEEGNIAEQGTHDQLIEKQGRYYDLFTYQSRI